MSDKLVSSKFEAVTIFLDIAERKGNQVQFTFGNDDGCKVSVDWKDLKKAVIDSTINVMGQEPAFHEMKRMIEDEEYD